MPGSTQFTDHFIYNRLNDPVTGTVIERTYGGLVIAPLEKRRIRTADIKILQNDKQFEADMLAGLIVVTYPAFYLTHPAFPEGFLSSDGFTIAALDLIKGLGQRQAYQSISFQRSGLISLAAPVTPIGANDPGGVWLKHGTVASDVSPPGVTSTPALIRFVASWNGTVAAADSVAYAVYMRKLSTDLWSGISSGISNGTGPVAFTVNLASSDFGNSPQIACRVTQGIVTDMTLDLVITG